MRTVIKTLATAAAFAAALPAGATSVVRISAADFRAGAGLITFSEFAVGTQNPVYAPSTYGGGVNSPTVTFGGFFVGQAAGSTNPSACPPGAAISGCVIGTPTGPLTLDARSPATFIANDAAQPTAPVLSGSPIYNGSISVLFSTLQSGVGFDAGYFNAVGGTGIRAFGANGQVLGTVANTGEGVEFLGLVTDDGSEAIAGVQLTLVGNEPAGFDIDNLRFARAGQVVVPGVPEPAAWALLIGGFGAVGQAARRRRATILRLA